mgnify:CR=1 FL=1
MKPIQYLALPSAHADAALLAAFPDGKLAITFTSAKGGWRPIPAPDPSLLWPGAVHTAGCPDCTYIGPCARCAAEAPRG